MGAHNTFHEIGPKFGVMVASLDFVKGSLAVFLAYLLGLNLSWQILAAVLAIIGHDFPIFANFKGGQGTATSLGAMMILFPVPTLIGLCIYGISFLFIKSSNIGLGIGGATIAVSLGFSQNWQMLGFAVIIFLLIPLKMLIDSSRRRSIKRIKKSMK